MIYKMICATCLAVLLSLSAALAQSVLGETTLNGRSVILNDDFTWRYAETAQSADPGECFVVTQPYVFCGKPLGWTVTSKLSPDATASFRLDDRNYLAVIREGLGSNDGFSLDFMQNAMIQNLATAAGLNTQDIPTYSVEEVELAGAPARRVVYGATIQGLDVIYYNTVTISESETIQFFSFVVAKEPSEAGLQTHIDAAAAFRRN